MFQQYDFGPQSPHVIIAETTQLLYRLNIYIKPLAEYLKALWLAVRTSLVLHMEVSEKRKSNYIYMLNMYPYYICDLYLKMYT